MGYFDGYWRFKSSTEITKNGEQTFEIVYEDNYKNTMSVNLNVKGKIDLSYINITKYPDKSKYNLNDTIETEGIVVTGYLQDGSTIIIPKKSGSANGWYINDMDITVKTYGDSVVTVYYTDENTNTTFSDVFPIHCNVTQSDKIKVTESKPITSLPDVYSQGSQLVLDDYHIAYVYNLLTGTAFDEDILYNSTYNISDKKDFTYNGRKVSGWNTNPDGSGNSYSLNQISSDNLAGRGAIKVLYAQYKENEPPSVPTIAVEYQNGSGNTGKLDTSGKEIGTFTVTPGVDPEGEEVTTTFSCMNPDGVSLSSISTNKYKAEFTKASPAVVFRAVSKDPEGLSSDSTLTCVINREDGSFSGTGKFTKHTSANPNLDVRYKKECSSFKSSKSALVPGCYISKIGMKVYIGSHNNTNGYDYILAYRYNSYGQLIKNEDGTDYQIIYSGNFGNVLDRSDGLIEYQLSDDVRQVELYVACVGHDHLTCVSENSNITWNLSYTYSASISDNPDTTPEPETPTPSEEQDTSEESEDSTYYNLDTVKDFTHNWGYKELGSDTALTTAYTRIYNSYINNGNKSKVRYTNRSTNAITEVDATVSGATGDNSWLNGMLYVPIKDLNITYDDGEIGSYLIRMIEQDCPEVMWKWVSTAPYAYTHSSNTYTALYLAHYSVSERNTLLNTVENTFNIICNLVHTNYPGITYQNDTYDNNNARYTELQKKQIAKVIHDYLELHNHYGDNSATGYVYNQNLYAAMSNGDKDPVCASYTQAFKYCCDRWGIPCIAIIGHVNDDTNGNHAWNIVSYKSGDIKTLASDSNNWQEVDCTWDDLSSRATLSQDPEQFQTMCIWDHFNVTTEEINSGVTVAQLELGNDMYIPSWKGADRFRDYAFSSSENANGADEIGVYKTYPTGTCTSNKFTKWDRNYDTNAEWQYKGF